MAVFEVNVACEIRTAVVIEAESEELADLIAREDFVDDLHYYLDEANFTPEDIRVGDVFKLET